MRVQTHIWVIACCAVLDWNAVLLLAYPSNNYRDLDICNHWNGRRHFLELGERGELHARNVTTSAYRVEAYEKDIS